MFPFSPSSAVRIDLLSHALLVSINSRGRWQAVSLFIHCYYVVENSSSSGAAAEASLN